MARQSGLFVYYTFKGKVRLLIKLLILIVKLSKCFKHSTGPQSFPAHATFYQAVQGCVLSTGIISRQQTQQMQSYLIQQVFNH